MWRYWAVTVLIATVLLLSLIILVFWAVAIYTVLTHVGFPPVLVIGFFVAIAAQAVARGILEALTKDGWY